MPRHARNQGVTKLRLFFRYALGLRRFVSRSISLDDALGVIRDARQREAGNFLELARRTVFDYPNSPYLPLFRRAGVTFMELERQVLANGVQAVLRELHDAGVYIRFDEFKGRQPIRRGNLEYRVSSDDFMNPWNPGDLHGQTGGSGGRRRRAVLDLGLIEYDAACHRIYQQAFGIAGATMAIWRGVPPNSSGINKLLLQTRVGRDLDRWFSPIWYEPGFSSLQYRFLTLYTCLAARLAGRKWTTPQYVPLHDVDTILDWILATRARKEQAVLDTTASAAVRLCRRAVARGADISGTCFRVGSETFDNARLEAVTAAGCRAGSHYAISELGPLAMACAAPGEADACHVLSGKLCVLPFKQQVGTPAVEVDALYLTTTHPRTPQILINLESGDYADSTEASCGCFFATAGFGQTLSRIRSYEKLTGEGVTFLGTDLLRLLDEVLPRTFGGGPTDYQFVESDVDGLRRVSLRVSPRIGFIREDQVCETVLEFLAHSSAGGRMMTDTWRDAGTLNVVREEPAATSAGKIPPLFLARES